MSSQPIRMSVALLLILLTPKAMGQYSRKTIDDFNICKEEAINQCAEVGRIFSQTGYPRTTTFLTGPIESNPLPPPSASVTYHRGYFGCQATELEGWPPINTTPFFGQQVYIMRTCDYFTGTDFDLSIRGITLQQGAVNRTGNPANVSAASPLSVNVDVSRAGITASFDAEVSLQYGSLVLKKNLYLLSGPDGGARQTVAFDLPLNPSDSGEKVLSVSIKGIPPVQEVSSTNNTMTKSIRLVRTCNVEDSGPVVPFFSQVDPGWAADPFGIPTLSANPGTMFDYGCGVSAASMVFRHYGINRTPIGSPLNPNASSLPGLGGQVLTPKTLNAAMANYGTMFISKGSVALNANNDPIWAGVAEVGRASYMTECRQSGAQCDSASAVSFKDPSKLTLAGEDLRRAIESEVCNGNPVIVKFRKSGGGQHFMLAIGTSLADSGSGTFRLHNPGSDSGAGVPYNAALAKKYPEPIGMVLFRPSRDPSMIFMTAPTNVHFIVSDTKGRRTGYDPVQDIRYNEIPNSSYGNQSIDNPEEPGVESKTLVRERYFAASGDVASGEYSVQVFSVNSGTYYLDIRSFDTDGFTNNAIIHEGTLQVGQTGEFKFDHSDLPRLNSTPVSFMSKGYLVSQLLGVSRSSIALTGKLQMPAGTKLNFSSNFEFRIGGSGGFTLSVPANKFKMVNFRNVKTYTYSNQGNVVSLSDDGTVSLAIAKANLSSVGRSKVDLIGITVDNLNVEQKLNAKCLGPICWSN